MRVSAAALLCVLGTPGASASAPATDSTDILQSLVEVLDNKLNDQKAYYEELMAKQQKAYEAQLAALQRTISGDVVEEPKEPPRRQLEIDLDSFAGVKILKDDSAIVFGSQMDAVIMRSGDSQLTVTADLNTEGALTITADGETTDVGSSLSDLVARVSAVETAGPYAKASMDFGFSWDVAYTTADVPFGADGGQVIFDSPHTAVLGYGRFSEGVFTAPADGVYYITSKVRVEDGSQDSDDMEIEFAVNDVDTEGFEMWVTTGDSSTRRSAMSSFLTYLREGDRLYPFSDHATSYGFMGQTDVFQVAPDRVAFNVMATGEVTNANTPLLTGYTTRTVDFITNEDSVSDDGVFTAPIAGLYYFTCKVRLNDYTDGDMEIEWRKNDGETDNSFEMWLHTGDAYERRGHMSAMLIDLEEGDTVYAISDQVLDTSHRTTFSGFQLPDDSPAFKVSNNGAFSYTSSQTYFGAGASINLDLERGSDGAFADGIYTVPEDGVYYFTTKLRTGDNDNADIEIEWKKNGADASTNNYEMWLHLGDSSGRRSGMSATMLRCVKGDEIAAWSDASFSSSDDVIASWTFSGFKLQ